MKQKLMALLASLLGVSKSVLAFVLPVVAAISAASLERLLPAALAIVEELATSKLSGPEKKAKAISRLTAEAKAEGLTVSKSLLNSLVEAAVQNLKAKAQ